VLKIGDFSKLVRVSIRMLHHYDQLGLLKPIRVDADTDYRYYGVYQMARLNRILALKDLGLSLAQIAAMLDQPLSAEQLRGMLRLQQADLRQRVEREQARLARVEARLRLITQEGTMSHDGVVLKPVAAQTVAAAREVIDNPHIIPARCRALRDLLREALPHAGVKASGASFVIFHDKGLRDEPEMAARLSSDNRLATYELSAVETVAAFIHHGRLATIEETYAAAWRWVEANGYRMVGPWPYREVYLSEEDGADDAVIEVRMPVQLDERLAAIQALVPDVPLDRLAALHERARRAIAFAVQEAADMRHPAIGVEHLLLGLLRAGNGIAGQMLADLGVTLDAARQIVVASNGEGVGQAAMLTEPARQVLIEAITPARQPSDAAVTTGDLLLIMVRAPGGATRLLEELGVEPQQVGQLLEERMHAGQPGID
jgi:DNA-binding transcriptional MerR regulator